MKRIVFTGMLLVLVSFQPGWGYSTQQQESSGGLLDIAFEIASAPCSLLAACLGMDGTGPAPQDCFVVCVPPEYVCKKPPRYVCTRPTAPPCYVLVVPSASTKPPIARTAAPKIPETISAPEPQARPSTPPKTADQVPSEPVRPPVEKLSRPSPPKETQPPVTQTPRLEQPRLGLPEPLQDEPRKMPETRPSVRTVPQVEKQEPPQKQIVPPPSQARTDKPPVVVPPSPPATTEPMDPPSVGPSPKGPKEHTLDRTPAPSGGMAPPRIAERPETPAPPKKEKVQKKTEKKRYRTPCSPCYPRYYGYSGMHIR